MATKQPNAPVSIETLKAQFDAKLRAEIEHGLATLRPLVESTIARASNEIIANAIGVQQDRWHNDIWEVDHCNGRRTTIANELGAEAMKRVKEAVPGFIAEWVKTPNKKLKAAMQREFEDTYERALLKAVEEAAEELARKDALALLEAFKQGKGTTYGND